MLSPMIYPDSLFLFDLFNCDETRESLVVSRILHSLSLLSLVKSIQFQSPIHYGFLPFFPSVINMFCMFPFNSQTFFVSILIYYQNEIISSAMALSTIYILMTPSQLVSSGIPHESSQCLATKIQTLLSNFLLDNLHLNVW